MGKLELKHIAPYLPYGLRIKGENIEYELSGYKLDDWFNWGYPPEDKPILRPLSDLTQEIEHNGERFVPIMRLCDLSHKDMYWSEDGGKFITKDDGKEIIVTHNCYESYWGFAFNIADKDFYTLYEPDTDREETMYTVKQLQLFEKLYEWHFDVFELCDRGLAIRKERGV